MSNFQHLRNKKKNTLINKYKNESVQVLLSFCSTTSSFRTFFFSLTGAPNTFIRDDLRIVGRDAGWRAKLCIFKNHHSAFFFCSTRTIAHSELCLWNRWTCHGFIWGFSRASISLPIFLTTQFVERCFSVCLFT